MDAVWRFFRTVGWASVGVVAVTFVLIPLLEALKVGDQLGMAQAVVVGGLTVIGAGLLAILTALVQQNAEQLTATQRALFQFAQTAIAGLVAPVVADTLVDTVVNYGNALWATLLTAVVAALQAYVVNAREASRVAATPAPAPRPA